MHLNKIITLTSSAAMLLFSACGSINKTGKAQNALPGTWQGTPIAIDGDSKDWPSPYPNYDSKAKIAYATSNDGNNLYITMESGDEMTQMKILKAGVTVSVDTGGHKNAEFNIRYPLENDNTEIEIPRPDNDSRDAALHASRQMTNNIRKAVDVTNQFSLDGFKSCDGGYTTSQVTPCGIKVKIRLDEYKQLVWETAIPFKVLYGKEISAAEAGKPISVCYTVAGLKKPKSGSVDNVNNNMGSDMNATPGTQRNSMQNGGPRRTSGDSPMEHLYNTTKTWKQTSLAFQAK